MSHLLCVSCDRRIHEGIFNDAYPILFLKVIWPVIALVPLLFVYFRSVKRGNDPRTPVIAVALLLGMGLGGFLDAIVLHQILQWHQMISNITPNTTYITKSVNMYWDGVFEATTWTTTLIGVLLLWHTRGFSGLTTSHGVLAGGMLAGWGVFNLIDSANHFVLRLHNVRELVPYTLQYDLGFLGLAFLLIGAGWWMMKRS